MRDLLLSLTIVAAASAGGLTLVGRAGGRPDLRPPPIVLVVLALTAVPSLLQLRYPAVLTTLQRDSAALARGEWWRLATPLVVQDGGIAGTIFNLVALLIVGTLGARVLGSRPWLTLYLVVGVAAEVVAYAWIHQGSAGNSVANFGVAAGLALMALRMRQKPAVAAGVATLLGGAALLLLGDLHGAAFAIGLPIAFFVARRTNAGSDAERDRPARGRQSTNPKPPNRGN
ncbi:MAG: rhomboid family intramembrane serine protease [Thermomicrobiales bacterium]|nr:rhomboid family intramembrane serine protease [Thermomicrobiales bacterium]